MSNGSGVPAATVEADEFEPKTELAHVSIDTVPRSDDID